MSFEAVQRLVRELSGFANVDDCSLIDADSGMTWFHSGSFPGGELISEAALEMWRVQVRLAGHFGPMGTLQSAAFSFSHRTVALFPCCDTPPLVLVCIAHRKNVPWTEWGRQVATLRQALKNAVQVQEFHPADAVPDATT